MKTIFDTLNIPTDRRQEILDKLANLEPEIFELSKYDLLKHCAISFKLNSDEAICLKAVIDFSFDVHNSVNNLN
jgi:hypothetical protein